MSSIFEKIIAREIPAHIVFEDDHLIAFLDIGPLSTGHTLVVPKQPAATLAELSDDHAAAIGRALPRLCRAVSRATGCDQYNILQNNGPLAHQAVPHVHFHIIPKPNESGGLSLEWNPGKLPDKEAQDLANQISKALKDA